MAELGLFKAILGLKKAELELFGGNIQARTTEYYFVKFLQQFYQFDTLHYMNIWQ